MKDDQKTPLDQGVLQMVDVAALVPSPLNPRIVNEKSESFMDLVESIKTNGVVVPVHVRPHPTKKGKLDLLAGERRRRATKKAGITKIPAVNHGDIDAAAAFEICFLENYGRKDLSPLEQGKAVDTLLTKYKNDVQAVSAKMGKPVRWVMQRRALGTNLSDKWKKGIIESRFLKEWTVSHLQVIAGLPTEIQDRLFDEYETDEIPTVEHLSQHVASAMHLLSKAPFSVVDTSSTGIACLVCPKRTSVKPGLWDDALDEKKIKANDRCLDFKCWTDKVLAWLEFTFKEKLNDMPTLVPIATESLYGDNKEYIIDTVPTFANMLNQYEYDACKKTDKDAFPGLVVFGKAPGTILWCKTLGAQAEKTRTKKAPGVPTPLAARRLLLQGKRNAEFLLRLTTIVEGKSDPGDIVFKKGFEYAGSIHGRDLMLLALADTFGVMDHYHHKASDEYGSVDTMAPWRKLNKLIRNPKTIQQILWSNLQPVLCEAISYTGPKTQTLMNRVTSSKQLAALLGIKTNPIVRQIKKDMPEPRSWANLNADGTPKAKKKKVKAKAKKKRIKKTDPLAQVTKTKKKDKVRKCRICGCTETKPCIIKVGPGRGMPCHWIEPDLCSAPKCAMDQHKGLGQKSQKKTTKAAAKKSKRKRPQGMIKPKS